MSQYNYLLDKDFLKELDSHRERTIYARITALDFQENPLQQIEGRITQGSINIDGTSAVRRTSTLTLLPDNIVQINDTYWGVKHKFKLEVGLLNKINDSYPNIIWFPQGIYIITGFNNSINTNSQTINISGKDKMCLLNGDIGGSLTAQIDFGVEEYLDKETNEITYTNIPIERIIREAVHTWAQEPYYNIVINDMNDTAVELLEYRGDIPLYLIYDINAGEYTNFFLNDQAKVYWNNKESTLAEFEKNGGIFYSGVDLEGNFNNNATVVYSSWHNMQNKTGKTYHLRKIEYGDTPGYRKTELTYPGELIANIGESVTSILDKIVKMLGQFEYFYDLDGRFIFQKKQNFLQTNWNSIVEETGTNSGESIYAMDAAYASGIAYRFEGNNLITSFTNTPNIQNLRNDFSIWGERTGVSGAAIPVHYRYAIDRKPTRYVSLGTFNKDTKTWENDSKIYTSNQYDWRELIYRMALDYFKYNQRDDFETLLIEKNGRENYPQGLTGYEQYYIDLQGFWRQLYDPEQEPQYDLLITDMETQPNDNSLYIKSMWNTVSSNDIIEFLRDGVHTIYNTYLKNDNKLTTIASYPKNNLENFYLEWSYVEGSSSTKDFAATYNSQKSYWDITPIYSEDNSKITGFSKCESKKYWIFGKDNVLVPLEEGKQNLYNLGEIYYDDGNVIYLAIQYFNPIGVFFYEEELDEYVSIETGYGVLNLYNIELTPLSKGHYSQRWDYDDKYWNKSIEEDPSTLNFWFDFLDDTSQLGQFSTRQIGIRPKVINDNQVKAIYFKEVPKLIYSTNASGDRAADDSGYNYIGISQAIMDTFTISSQGKSAKDVLDEYLYQHTYCTESITITTIPIYYLNPNTRIFVLDTTNNINGEYIVSRLTIPLSYNGTMSITATKAPEQL